MSELAESTTHSEVEPTTSAPRQGSHSPSPSPSPSSPQSPPLPQSPQSPQSPAFSRHTQKRTVKIVGTTISNLTDESNHNQDDPMPAFVEIGSVPGNPRVGSDSMVFSESEFKSGVPKDIIYVRGHSAFTLESLKLAGLSYQERKIIKHFKNRTRAEIELELSKDHSGYTTSDNDGSGTNFFVQNQVSNEYSGTPDSIDDAQGGVSTITGYDILNNLEDLHQYNCNLSMFNTTFSINASEDIDENDDENVGDDADNSSVKKK